MKILHTSDWHLGHTLNDHSRENEHAAFLAWLLDTLETEAIDALIICGDIFDNANPSARSQGMWYQFLVNAQQRLPGLDVVVIGGNHDSAARLDAPSPLLSAFRVRVVGGIPYNSDGSIDWKQILIPLHDSDNSVGAWVVAMPFLRQADLPPQSERAGDPLIDGVRQRYIEAIAAAREILAADQALVLTGHCYMSGAVISDLSERKILGGNQHALPVDIFPDDIAYAALGHLHRPQSVGNRKNVRYSGSPLPLSVSEIFYDNQVCLVEIIGTKYSEIRKITVPRSIDFLRIPEKGELPLESLLSRLQELPDSTPDIAPFAWPYLEVAVTLTKPEPALRENINKALDGKGVRLVRIVAATPNSTADAAAPFSGKSLSDITPEDIFINRYSSRYAAPPSPEYLAAFHELIESVNRPEVEP